MPAYQWAHNLDQEGGDVQRTAHIFDDDIWALSHGKFNIPGYKGEIHLIHAPVEVQFVHLIADAQLTSLPGEVRGGAGEEKSMFTFKGPSAVCCRAS